MIPKQNLHSVSHQRRQLNKWTDLKEELNSHKVEIPTSKDVIVYLRLGRVHVGQASDLKLYNSPANYGTQFL